MHVVNVGQPFVGNFSGTDADLGNLTLTHLGLPPGATLTPVSGTTQAQPFPSMFNWTPQLADAGSSYAVSIVYTDPAGLQGVCSFSINVPLQPTVCGNNVQEPGEQCDGTDDGACPGLCVPAGNPNECTCGQPPVCGNNIVDAGEQCDGTADAACPGNCLPPGDPNECTCAPTCGNNVVDAGEQCDGTADAACPGNCAPPSSPDECVCLPPDHFKCYKARGEFQQRSVSLADQFGPSTATVLRPDRFCNPVDKNNEGITHPDAHLNCYKIREPHGPSRDVVVSNQFGEQQLTTTRTHTLCLPAIKDQIGDLNTLDINHFKCYRVRSTPGAPRFTERDVQLADQFEIKNTTVSKAFLLCNPVDKNGEGIPDQTNHIVCYKVRDVSGQPAFVPQTPNVTDQFVVQDLQTSRRTDCGRTRLLCVPSSKRIASPSGAFLDGGAGALLE